jgi:hypothetical protein
MDRPTRKAARMTEWVLHCEVKQRHIRRSQPTRDAALKDACSQLLQGGEERVLRMRFGIGMNTDHTLEEVGPAVLSHARAHPPDRGQGAKEAEASKPLEGAEKLPG